MVVPGVTVLHVDLASDPVKEAEALAMLHREERDRSHRFRYPQHRRQYILCRAALRSVLCSQLDCGNKDLAFDTFERGKPFALVKGTLAPISFNLSHSGSHGLIAVADRGCVGVDVEERSYRRDISAIMKSVFTPEEQADLVSVGGLHRVHSFYRFWTIKEAFIKAVGTGLSLSPSRFEVPLAMRRGGAGSLFEFPEMPGVQWWLEDLGNERFAAAIAHELDSGRPAERLAG